MEILFIEDIPELRNLYEKKLKCHGADKYTEFAPYDLYILDMKTDSEVCIKDQIKQIRTNSNSPIWILSNYGENYIKEKILPFKADKILSKIEYRPKKLKSLIDENFS